MDADLPRAARLTRRDLVRWTIAGGVPLLAGACSSSSRTSAPTSSVPATAAPATSTTTTTTTTAGTTPPPSTVAATTTAVEPVTAPGTTAPFDPTRGWWLQAGFAPVERELEGFDLTVRGALPPELDGLYVRNGSNPPHADTPHWFFGDGMVHGVRLSGGKAEWYRNRYVATNPHRQGWRFGEGAPGGENNQSNVSCLWHGGKLLTSGEVGFPYQLDPRDLSTTGVTDFAGALQGSFTAHPKIDPATGRMHAFGYDFTAPFLRYHVIEPDGTLAHSEAIDIPRSTMMHDFAITESDVVFWDLPVVFDMALAIQMVQDPAKGIIPFRWDPAAGARIGVMPLGGPASALVWIDVDPCYVFHSVNAFRSGDTISVDVCRLTSMFDATAAGLGGDLSLRRWTIDTAERTVRDDVLETDDPGELPTRDPRLVGRRHRHGYLVASRQDANGPNLGGLIKHDFTTGARVRWDPGPTRHSGEWLFVPGDARDAADDAGWLLGYVHDDATGATVLAVVDATDVAAGPVAEVLLPQRVPYGFHATWVPGAAIE